MAIKSLPLYNILSNCNHHTNLSFSETSLLRLCLIFRGAPPGPPNAYCLHRYLLLAGLLSIYIISQGTRHERHLRRCMWWTACINAHWQPIEGYDQAERQREGATTIKYSGSVFQIVKIKLYNFMILSREEERTMKALMLCYWY